MRAACDYVPCPNWSVGDFFCPPFWYRMCLPTKSILDKKDTRTPWERAGGMLTRMKKPEVANHQMSSVLQVFKSHDINLFFFFGFLCYPPPCWQRGQKGRGRMGSYSPPPGMEVLNHKFRTMQCGTKNICWMTLNDGSKEGSIFLYATISMQMSSSQPCLLWRTIRIWNTNT